MKPNIKLRAENRLRRSKKFSAWRRKRTAYMSRNPLEQSAIMAAEKHFSPAELAKSWGVRVETVREIFRSEPGVLKLGKTGSKYRRGYITLRITESVAERVHQRLAA